jgi:enterochelin esterase-like enzyme
MKWRAAAVIGLGAVVAAAGAYVFIRDRSALPVVGVDSWTMSTSIRSELLGRDMPIQVFRPPSSGDGEPLPVLFLFHGRGADETQWMAGRFGDGVGVDSLAHRLIDAGSIDRLAIVSAMIDDSYGIDSANANDGYSHGPYEAYILTELVPQVEQQVGVGGDRTRRAVGGLSMGGFAALNVALRHPELFSGVGALSPALFINAPTDRTWIYRDHDLLAMIDTGQATQMRVFVGAGSDDYDWIRTATSELTARLTGKSASLTTRQVPGGHDAGMWRQLAEPMLRALFGRA